MTVLKTFFQKQSPKVISYRNYENFSNNSIRRKLISNTSSDSILEGDLTISLVHVKNRALCKKKYTRVNKTPFQTKQISNELIIRSRLRNKYLCCRFHENKETENRQRNCCVKPVRSAKKLSNISIIKVVRGNKRIWKVVLRI